MSESLADGAMFTNSEYTVWPQGGDEATRTLLYPVFRGRFKFIKVEALPLYRRGHAQLTLIPLGFRSLKKLRNTVTSLHHID